MRRTFPMYRNVFTRLNLEPVQLVIRACNHQVQIQRNPRHCAQAAAKVCSKCIIRYEFSIHNMVTHNVMTMKTLYFWYMTPKISPVIICFPLQKTC